VTLAEMRTFRASAQGRAHDARAARRHAEMVLAHREYVAAVLAEPRPGETPAPFDEWNAAQSR